MPVSEIVSKKRNSSLEKQTFGRLDLEISCSHTTENFSETN